MEKIYSRKRIKIPKLEIVKIKNKKNSKRLRLLIIIIIAILTFYLFLKFFEPIYDGFCNQKVIDIATNIINIESKKVLDKYEYSELVTTIKDASGTNTVVTNVELINGIASEITYEIENKLARINQDKIEIPLGSIIGNKYISSLGPRLKININPIGNVTADSILATL